MLVLVDGAHALGAIDLNLEGLGADFYVSNAHKWLCNPKGAAFMYVTPLLQKHILPLIISHGSGVGFLSDFIWTGAQDYAPMLTLPFVISIWKNYGIAFRQYISELLSWAMDFLLKEWKTELLAERSMYATMATIRVPGSDAKYPEEHNDLQDALFFKHKIEVPIKRFGDAMYVRISVHIYNCKEDYMILSKAMLHLRLNSKI